MRTGAAVPCQAHTSRTVVVDGCSSIVVWMTSVCFQMCECVLGCTGSSVLQPPAPIPPRTPSHGVRYWIASRRMQCSAFRRSRALMRAVGCHLYCCVGLCYSLPGVVGHIFVVQKRRKKSFSESRRNSREWTTQKEGTTKACARRRPVTTGADRKRRLFAERNYKDRNDTVGSPDLAGLIIL